MKKSLLILFFVFFMLVFLAFTLFTSVWDFATLHAQSTGAEEANQPLIDFPDFNESHRFTTLPSPGISPTSPLYFLDRLGESIRSLFTRDPESRALLHIEYAGERIAEIKVLLAEKNIDPRGLTVASERLSLNIEKARASFEKKKATGEDISVLAGTFIQKMQDDRAEALRIWHDALQILLDQKETLLKEVESADVKEKLGSLDNTKKEVLRIKDETLILLESQKNKLEKDLTETALDASKKTDATFDVLKQGFENLERAREASFSVKEEIVVPTRPQETPSPPKESAPKETPKSNPVVNTIPKSPCDSEKENARLISKDRMCTAQVETLVCPHTNTVTYLARNGCEISFLKNLGWKSKEIKATPLPLPTPPSTPKVEEPIKETPITEEPKPVTPKEYSFAIDADDYSFYINSFPVEEVSVERGSKVTITYKVRTDNVYFAGLSFDGCGNSSGSVSPGQTATFIFTPEETCSISSYWPSLGLRKDTMQVVIK